jgi:hypothetical protein
MRIICKAALLGLFLSFPVKAELVEFFRECFSVTPTNLWGYDGHSPDLLSWDPSNSNIKVEWDASKSINTFSDPMEITASSYTAPLGREMSDYNTFRVRVTLTIDSNSVPNTTEFYQLASFGLYNLSETGPDRTLADNFSGNSNLVKDASDFVEFSYFINNASFGFNPNISATIGAHIEGLNFDYTTGSSFSDPDFYHDTDMGAGNYLPTGIPLYLELIYHGNTPDTRGRRARCSVYTNASRTELLLVNGVEMYYWTQPLANEKHFTVTEIGFWNWPAANFGGANGQGSGTWDDVIVELKPPGPISGIQFTEEHITLDFQVANLAETLVSWSSNLVDWVPLLTTTTNAGAGVSTVPRDVKISRTNSALPGDRFFFNVGY